MILSTIRRLSVLRFCRLVRAAAFLILLPASAHAQQHYLFGALPNLPVTTTTPNAIAFDVNDSTMVVGQSSVGTGASGLRAFSWTRAGHMIPIPPLPGGENAPSVAKAVNNSGQVVGSSGVAGGSHAFLWTSGAGTIDLGVLGSSASIPPSALGNGLNNAGMVVGASTTTLSIGRAFIWAAGSGMTDLGTLGGPTSVANDVNDSGVVVGSSATASGQVHAFVWTQGSGMVDIGTPGLGGTDSRAFRINNAGVVVGQARVASGEFHAFRWTSGGGMVDLGTLGVPTFGGPTSSAVDINDSGQIVGTTTITGVVGLHAFSWTPAGGMVAIGGANAFAQPSAVNNIGNVVGTNFGNPTEAILWRSPQQDLIMDFPGAGTWMRRGTVWSQLHSRDAKAFGVFGEFGRDHDDVAVDFGPGVGLWAWTSDDTWFQLHSLSPTGMAMFDVNGDGDDDVVASFAGAGIWWFNGNTGEWAGQLHGLDPSSFLTLDLDPAGMELVVDFPGFGLWTYAGGSWAPLHSLDVTSMIATDLDGNGTDDLVVNFPTYGVWAYMNGTSWVQIHTRQAKRMAAGNLDGNARLDLVIDFGPGVGVWVLSNLTTWTPLHTFATENIVVADLDGNGKAEVIIDFGGPGLWSYEDGRGWLQMHSLSPAAMAFGRLH